jgi:hypothetical protein
MTAKVREFPADMRPMETAPRDGTTIRLYGPWVPGDVFRWGSVPVHIAGRSHPDRTFGWLCEKGLLIAELAGWLPL